MRDVKVGTEAEDSWSWDSIVKELRVYEAVLRDMGHEIVEAQKRYKELRWRKYDSGRGGEHFFRFLDYVGGVV